MKAFRGELSGALQPAKDPRDRKKKSENHRQTQDYHHRSETGKRQRIKFMTHHDDEEDAEYAYIQSEWDCCTTYILVQVHICMC